MKIVILGGTGLIGSKVVNLLRAGGHEVVAASPSQGINSITGEGLTEALTGAQVVVDVTNSPSFEDKPAGILRNFTRNLLAAESEDRRGASCGAVGRRHRSPDWSVPVPERILTREGGPGKTDQSFGNSVYDCARDAVL